MDDSRPLADLDHWEEDLLRRYPEPADTPEAADTAQKPAAAFRDYAAEARPSVRRFYELNHRHQTIDFVRAKREEYLGLTRMRMGIWQAMEYLNQLVDDSDPDLDLPQIEHLLQTAEAIRAAGKPEWYVLAGLVHDLGKILCIWGEPQWAVVGDTFPVGCRFSERALAMIRWHSCYPVHREGAYDRFLTAHDRELLDWVRDFNRFDLYTKRDERMDVAALRPFYQDLIDRHFPAEIAW